ncbi:RING-H2 zinc finger protein [Quillaja saponaria]|uniref:RING-H2 zinc finger protein n=1 Tax=Quillaja saponaria TaxID=32244 RepID=A0AAD7QCS2_QUISA|nr:RING-H2 zinc finger protein [Quillaja saponaria]
MGKRKRISDQNQKDHPLSCPSSSEAMQCSSEMELLSEEKLSHSGDHDELKSLSPGLDIMDGSMKLLNAHPTDPHHNQSLCRSIFLKRSRHYYGHQYSRRNSANHAHASSSRAKSTSLHHERLSFKLASQSNSESGLHSEIREKPFCRPERIRSSSLVVEAVSSDVVKMVCGVCQKPLRRRLHFLGNSLPSNELSVVAILFCGHIYHADCLEQKTSFGQRCDPPCPLCAGLLTQVGDSDSSRRCIL